MTTDLDMIDYLAQNGFALDLAQLLSGENEYADKELLERLDRHSDLLRGMTVRHLKFIAEFGDIAGPVEKGKHILSPYPEYFLAWKLADFPGVRGYQLTRLYEERVKGSYCEGLQPQ